MYVCNCLYMHVYTYAAARTDTSMRSFASMHGLREKRYGVSFLLQTVIAWLSKRRRSKACARKHAPHHPRATTRPGHALRLVEKKSCANTLIHTKTKLCDMKHITKSHMLLLHCRSVIYMHTHTMKSIEMPVCPICVCLFVSFSYTYNVLCMNACMYVCMIVCMHTYLCTCIFLFLCICAIHLYTY